MQAPERPLIKTDFLETLVTVMANYDIPLSEEQANACHEHVSLMLAWNRTCNLTRITDLREIIESHLLDSLLPARWLPQAGPALDLGTGPRIPGHSAGDSLSWPGNAPSRIPSPEGQLPQSGTGTTGAAESQSRGGALGRPGALKPSLPTKASQAGDHAGGKTGTGTSHPLCPGTASRRWRVRLLGRPRHEPARAGGF